jgi:hypothetical protein
LAVAVARGPTETVIVFTLGPYRRRLNRPA